MKRNKNQDRNYNTAMKFFFFVLIQITLESITIDRSIDRWTNRRMDGWKERRMKEKKRKNLSDDLVM